MYTPIKDSGRPVRGFRIVVPFGRNSIEGASARISEFQKGPGNRLNGVLYPATRPGARPDENVLVYVGEFDQDTPVEVFGDGTAVIKLLTALANCICKKPDHRRAYIFYGDAMWTLEDDGSSN